MRHEAAIRRIESFGKRFGPSHSHLYLAYHAAFPLALTPDLLYRIWANFQRDIDRKLLNIPWIAVADILLSNLCDEVGHELYEMDVAVRNELLKRLQEDSRFGEKRINELSNFLLAYVRKNLNSSEPDQRDFAQSQRWTALAYKDSEQAARELALAFNEAYQQDRAELVRLATLTETLAQPLQECEKLLIYARAMGHYARKKIELSITEFTNLGVLNNGIKVATVNLPIPESLLNKIMSLQESKHRNHFSSLVADKPLVATNSTNSNLTNNLQNKTRERSTCFIPASRCRIVWGRNDLIEKVLNRITDPKDLSIFCLSGLPGYGKSELACKIAQAALKRNLFAEVLWVTARGTELVEHHISKEQRSEALNWDKFLHEIAHQLKCPLEQVRQHLKEEKRLVVLDNAETAEIEDILVNLNKMLSPSRALLTSRLHINPQFVGLIPVQGLEEEWSHKLLLNEAEYKKIPALLQAREEQLHRVHELSCGAPLALHFAIALVLEEQAIEPVLSALEQGSEEVEVFYRFALEPEWQRIRDAAKNAVRYMGQADAGVTQDELLAAWGLSNSDWKVAQKELKRWYWIAENQDAKGYHRYDLHPWVRRSVRGGLVEKWELNTRVRAG